MGLAPIDVALANIAGHHAEMVLHGTLKYQLRFFRRLGSGSCLLEGRIRFLRSLGSGSGLLEGRTWFFRSLGSGSYLL